MPRNEMVSPGGKEESEGEEEKKSKKGKQQAQKTKTEPMTVTPQVTTQQTTLGHSAAVKARDKAYQVRRIEC